jgi:hypothetical protein
MQYVRYEIANRCLKWGVLYLTDIMDPFPLYRYLHLPENTTVAKLVCRPAHVHTQLLWILWLKSVLCCSYHKRRFQAVCRATWFLFSHLYKLVTPEKRRSRYSVLPKVATDFLFHLLLWSLFYVSDFFEVNGVSGEKTQHKACANKDPRVEKHQQGNLFGFIKYLLYPRY